MMFGGDDAASATCLMWPLKPTRTWVAGASHRLQPVQTVRNLCRAAAPAPT